MKAPHICIIVPLFLFAPVHAFAQLEANFRANSLDYDGYSGNCDIAIIGLPTCELYFQMAVFKNNVQQGSLYHFPGGCNYQELEDGTWNFADQTITRQIPNLSTNAQLYFALFDEDPALADEDDLLGVHMVTVSAPGSASQSNNNVQPTGYAITTCDGGTPDNDSGTGRFSLSYSVWFTDQSAPAAYTPYHTDGGAPDPDGWDDDDRLDFAWPPASDPHSGIATYEFQLREDSTTVVYKALGAPGTTVSICSSGCNVAYPISEGSGYTARLRARNGATIQLQTPDWSAWTTWSEVVDVDYTADAITSILAYTEQGGIEISYGAAQGDASPYVEWQVAASTSPIVGYSTSLGPGPAPDCIVDTAESSMSLGPLPAGVTSFLVRAIDEAGNCGPTSDFVFNIVLPEKIFDDGFEVIPD